MPADFKGLLQSRHEQSRALQVSIAFSDDTVELSSELGFVGKWPSENVSVERSADNWFRLTLGQEEWDFLADDPTGFFLAAPLRPPGQDRKKPSADSSRLSELTKGAVGAMLAVFLLSLGIVIGRNRIDGSVLVVTIMLILAAVLGFWWAALKTQRQEHSHGLRGPGSAVRTDRPQTALRVEDVIRKKSEQSSASASSSPAASEPTAEDEDPSATVISEHDTHVDSAQDRPSPKPAQTERPSADEPAREPSSDQGIESRWIDVAFGADDDVSAEAALDGEQYPDGNNTPPADQREGPLLPTAAVKRYLAALSGFTDDEAESPDFTATPIEEEASETDGANPKEGSTMELTDIRGIGPALSNALSSLGVSDVRDLAELDSDDLDYLEEQLGRFGSRVRSERWVEQARQMVSDR